MAMRFEIFLIVGLCLTYSTLCTPLDKDDANSLQVLKREDKRCTPEIRRSEIKLCPSPCGPNEVCRKRKCGLGECCNYVAECVECRKDVFCIALAGCGVRTDQFGCQYCYCEPFPPAEAS